MNLSRMVSLCCAAMLAVAAGAFPTLLPGHTGTVMLPTAEGQPGGELTVAAAIWDTVGPNTFPIRAIYGVSDNFEVGGTYAFNQNSDIWALNTKYSAPAGGRSRVALGALRLEAPDLDRDVWQVYAAFSPIVTGVDARDQLRLTAGINWTDLNAATYSDEAIRVFGSFEGIIAGRAIVMGEIQSAKRSLSDSSPLKSFAVRYPTDRNLVFEGGVTNATTFGVTGGREQRFFVGAHVLTD